MEKNIIDHIKPLLSIKDDCIMGERLPKSCWVIENPSVEGSILDMKSSLYISGAIERRFKNEKLF